MSTSTSTQPIIGEHKTTQYLQKQKKRLGYAWIMVKLIVLGDWNYMIDKAKEMLTKYVFHKTKFHKTRKAHNGHEIDMITTNVKIRNK